ncbi:class I SAM-dependent methyltransferase [Ktedonospora formicarum]|uniref:Methyltransferase domain-containing protein n=1 Tax=Ktedonospora formicarum TaxID=2778364 RepID=A0A8J3IFD0_9CHLR|nr:class I SAM-dependent methyltransferase [Ktedonospora formicarum]GHO50899.1 hypothetical protein KSX_90620 [Ktedonospora formicarum]
MFHASLLLYSLSGSSGLLDPLAPAEQARVVAQYQMCQKVLREPLPELDNDTLTLSTPRMILDLGCGPHGQWACDVAFDYPSCHIFGVSTLPLYIEQAEHTRRLQELSCARFILMDFERELCFPDRFFDVINGRFLCSSLPHAYWQHLLRECLRVLRPGGMLRLTECSDATCTSSACEALSQYVHDAAQRSVILSHVPKPRYGRTAAFTPQASSWQEMLLEWLPRLGYQAISSTTHMLDFSAGSLYQQSMFRNAQSFFCQLAPRLCQSLDLTPAHLEALCERMHAEMLDPTFTGQWTLQVVRAHKGGHTWW